MGIGKKGVVWDALYPWLILILVLLVSISVYLVASGKLDYIGSLFSRLFRF